jgi:hypothetical protein
VTSRGRHLVDAYWRETGAVGERLRIIEILTTMREETHGDAWAALDDAINAISQNTNTTFISQNNDKEPTQ